MLPDFEKALLSRSSVAPGVVGQKCLWNLHGDPSSPFVLRERIIFAGVVRESNCQEVIFTGDAPAEPAKISRDIFGQVSGKLKKNRITSAESRARERSCLRQHNPNLLGLTQRPVGTVTSPNKANRNVNYSKTSLSFSLNNRIVCTKEEDEKETCALSKFSNEFLKKKFFCSSASVLAHSK